MVSRHIARVAKRDDRENRERVLLFILKRSGIGPSPMEGEIVIDTHIIIDGLLLVLLQLPPNAVDLVHD